MKRRAFVLAALLITTLACNAAARAFRNPTPTPYPTSTPTFTPTPLVPAYIPPGCEESPVATLSPDLQLETAPETQASPELDTAAQLRIFNEAVAVIEEVYVYPDFNGRDWDAIVEAHKATIESRIDTLAFYAEMYRLLDELGDEHSFFESPPDVEVSEAALEGTSSYVGIGTYLLPQPDKGQAVVISLSPDSPAQHAGLQPHDILLRIDDLPVVGNGESHTGLLRGPECSAVKVTVRTPGQPARQVLIMRQRIEGGPGIDAHIVPTSDSSRIGYIFIPTFFDETIPDQIATALLEFGTLDGLILDTRLNGGGSGLVGQATLAFFTEGTMGSFKSRKGTRPLTIMADPIQNSQSVPIIVLVGLQTASYGELFAGILKNQGRAQIVGQTTLGNVEGLHGHELEDGSFIWIAEETFEPAGTDADWETTGIIPDVQAYADWDTFTLESDPAISAALELLGPD